MGRFSILLAIDKLFNYSVLGNDKQMQLTFVLSLMWPHGVTEVPVKGLSCLALVNLSPNVRPHIRGTTSGPVPNGRRFST